jgi:hypothetical protein
MPANFGVEFGGEFGGGRAVDSGAPPRRLDDGAST